MKKITYVYIAVFIVLLFIPAVTMPLFRDDGSTEKRELAEFPSFVDESGKWNEDFTEQLDLYLADHIGFRKLLVEANSAWQAGIFMRSPEDSVIVGTDGWLFYSDTESDFLNVPRLSERNVGNIVRTLQLMSDYAEARGASFTVSFVPNKNTLYPEHMPYYYLPLNGDGDLEALEAAIAGAGVDYADIRSAFHVEDDVLYQRTDSHWDYRGALLGYRTIMAASGFEHEKYEGLGFTERADWSGDLAAMVYSDAAAPDVQYYPEYDFGYDIVSHETSVEALTLRTKNPEGHGKLLMFRDSFCNTMMPFFAGTFSDAVFSRAYPFPMDNIDRYGADVCVLEIVERNLPNLAKRAPLMQAPSVELSASASPVGEGSVTFFTEKRGSYMHLYGTVNEDLLGGSYRVYVIARGGDGSASAYEAFPIYEQELLKTDELCDNGYSAYFDTDMWEGFDEISVVVESDVGCYVSGSVNVGDIAAGD